MCRLVLGIERLGIPNFHRSHNCDRNKSKRSQSGRSIWWYVEESREKRGRKEVMDRKIEGMHSLGELRRFETLPIQFSHSGNSGSRWLGRVAGVLAGI